MVATPSFLVVGQIIRPHGIRGELRVKVLTNYPDHLLSLERVALSRSAEGDFSDIQVYEVERIRLHQHQAILKLEGLDDRTAAELFREQYLLVSLAEAVPLEADEFYHFQLIGLQMMTAQEQLVGTVREILETGANDVYVVEHPKWGEILVPAIPSVVQTIDLSTQRITIQPLEGLLPDDFE